MTTSKEKAYQRMEQMMEVSNTPKFGLSKDEKREFRKKFERKSTPKAVALILLTHLSIIASALIVVGGISSLGFSYSIILTLVGIIFISRQLRALENIVHFGSHYNITKGKKKRYNYKYFGRMASFTRRQKLQKITYDPP